MHAHLNCMRAWNPGNRIHNQMTDTACLKVVYLDDALLVLDKPHGQHTQPTPQGDDGSLLTTAQSQYGNQVRLVHRLDRDASGLIVMARTKRAATILAEGFRTHTIQRTYHAIINIPLPVDTEGTIKKPLKWSGGRCWVDASGVPATTHYRVIGRHSTQTRLECTLETGRMHQIRVHLSQTLGPIIGDRKYGGIRADKLMLRAVQLELNHPTSHERLTFQVNGFSDNN